MDRRQFLVRSTQGAATIAVAGGMASLLAACGSDGSDSASSSGGADGDLGTAAIQLNWVFDTSYSGMYLAEQNGYLKGVGFSKVSLLAGGSDIAPDPVVQTGRALIGVSNPDITASARAQGATLKVIGALNQRNPYVVLSMPDTPILEPAELVGKTVAMEAVNETPWTAFLTANDIDPSSVTTVPANYDISLLTSGSVDAYLGYVTNEPNILKQQGIEPVIIAFDDHNYPGVAETLMITEASAKDKRPEVKAALVALVKGWSDVVRDPDAAAKATVDGYGKDLKLDLPTQEALATTLAGVVWVPDSGQAGVLAISAERAEATVGSLKLGGVDTSVEDLFDLTLLEEVFAENPDLAGDPL